MERWHPMMIPVNNIHSSGCLNLEGRVCMWQNSAKQRQNQDLYVTGGSCRRSMSGLSDAQWFSAGREQKLPQLEEETYEFYWSMAHGGVCVCMCVSTDEISEECTRNWEWTEIIYSVGAFGDIYKRRRWKNKKSKGIDQDIQLTFLQIHQRHTKTSLLVTTEKIIPFSNQWKEEETKT